MRPLPTRRAPGIDPIPGVQSPNHPETWLSLGRQQWAEGQYSAGSHSFQQAYRLDPGPETAARLIQARIALAEIDQVLALTDRSIRRWPGVAPIELFAALAALHRRQPDRCLAHLERGLHAAPGNPALEVGRRLILQRLGRDRAIHPSGPVQGTGGSLVDSLSFWLQHHQAEWTAYPPLTLLEAARLAGPGLFLECGVYWGRSIRLLARATGRPVHGFDSFQGLPEDWSRREPRGSYSTGGRLPEVPPNVHLHQGWFEDTLPGFLAENSEPVALLHVDCDLYTSTRTVLDSLGPRLRPGSVIVFDDFVGFDGWREHEHRAWLEFAARRGIHCDVLWMSFLGREVALRISAIEGS